MPDTVTRQVRDDGSVALTCGRAAFVFRKRGAHVLDVAITGRDRGGFGPAVFDEIRYHFAGPASLELFVDASEAESPTTEVSDAWTRFLAASAPHLRRVSILAVSRFVHMTVSVAKLFSRTGELVQLYSDPTLFAAARDRALKPPRRRP